MVDISEGATEVEGDDDDAVVEKEETAGEVRWI